ncbi:MAG: ion transporter, partial [Planctomycetota bacterium]
LTSIDDLDPVGATADLELITDDVAWHVRNVESSRSGLRRRLKRKLRRLKAETQERQLQGRLEAIWGPKKVGWFERTVLFLIFLVLGILTADLLFSFPENVRYWLMVVDTLACAVFLWEFFVKLALVKGKGRWFLRHAFVDLLPSIPVGLLTLRPGTSDPIRAGRAIRLLRLTRVARYLRALAPLIRLIRAFGFLSRGLDRVVRRYGHLLNHDVILYPTRAEWARALSATEGNASRVRRIQGQLSDLWTDLLGSVPEPSHALVLDARLDALEAARRRGDTQRPPVVRGRVRPTREIPAEILLRRLGSLTPEAVEAEFSTDFISRAARAVRLFSSIPLRWLPLVRRCVPRLSGAMSDAEVTAAGANQAAVHFRRMHGRWFFFADLYGTITAAEFLDRVGTTLVKGAFRPAYRLTIFGGIFLLTQLLLYISRFDLLEKLADFLNRFVGTTLIVLGGICFLILAIGWWLKRIASEATSFYEQTAAAQFLPLTESIKARFLDRDAAIVDQRIFGHGPSPSAQSERHRSEFVDGVRQWLLAAHSGGTGDAAFDPMERTVLLYRDGMDGGLLHESDTRTTNQLLGNPALRHLRRTAWCIGRRARKELQALDLSRPRALLRGPYLWFSLITRAVAQSAARLIVDYNRYAIPLAEVASSSPEECARFDAWILGRDETPARQVREESRAGSARALTSAFTALHFLDDDPRRDDDVARRFGPRVLGRLRADRRLLFRRIFGTYPLHTRPHEQRVVNLYRLYEEWLAGGRAFLVPLRLIGRLLRGILAVLRWIFRSIREIRQPRSAQDMESASQAGFAVAVRKIDRMRGPVVRAGVLLRARMDSEYLGVRVPGTREDHRPRADAEADLDFLDVVPSLRRRVEEEHDRAQADMRRLARLLDGGLLTRVAASIGVSPRELTERHLRAAAFAYRADITGVRTYLSCEEVVREGAEQALSAPLRPWRWIRAPRLGTAFRRWWKQHGVDDRRARKAAWRWALNDVNGTGRALRVWARRGREAAERVGEDRLAALLRHPSRLEEQLHTLRIVQTLALIDVLNYRTHVFRLGRYADDGEEPGDLLVLADVCGGQGDSGAA